MNNGTQIRYGHEDNPDLGKKLAEEGGFVTNETLPGIIAVDRNILLLVRLNGGRFLAPADNVDHLVNLITDHSDLIEAKVKSLPKVHPDRVRAKHHWDYVRDVSLPTG